MRSHFWTDLNAVPAWRFPEIPPWQIERYLGSPVVDRWERVRAEWLWRRRPKVFIGNEAISYLLLGTVSILLLLVSVIGIFLDAGWLLCSSLLVASDIVRSVRWRRDYEVSLCRLVHTMRPPESI
jgi:hypothetical protein